MASKKKLTPAREKALQEYNKERRRIQSTVRRAMKRGYLFERGVVPPTVSELNFNNVPTVSIKAQTRKLHEVKPITLYKQATAVSMTTGKVVSGVQRRQEERHESAVVGSINRAEKQKELRSIQTIRQYWKQKENQVRQELGEEPAPEEAETDHGDYSVNLPTEEAKPWEDEANKITQDEINEYQQQLEEDFDRDEREFQAQQAERDKANRKRLDEDHSFRDQFTTGETTYRTILGMIDDSIKAGKGWGGRYLKNMLDEQIKEFGKEKVMLAIGNASEEMLSQADVVISTSDADVVQNGIARMAEIITGEIPSAEEMQRYGNINDMDAQYNEP